MKIKLIERNGKKFFVYHTSRQICKQDLLDIVYFERAGRRIRMYSLKSGDEEIYGSLAELYELLKGERFEYVNQSVIVNFDHITNVRNNYVKMSDGSNVEISRSKKRNVIDGFFDILN